MLWLDHIRSGIVKFLKSWLRTLGCRQKIHYFFFSYPWGTRFKYLLMLCPYILIYSALHIMQWFSQILHICSPRKSDENFVDFYILWIKTNDAYTRLEVIARTKYCTTTTASNWFVTLYYKLLPAVSSPSKHAVGDLAFYYTLYLWLLKDIETRILESDRTMVITSYSKTAQHCAGHQPVCFYGDVRL